MSTGKWALPGVPHRGWTCVDMEDLGEPDEICEMCEVTEIRYVHLMEHDEYPDTLRCGCICASHMEGDYVGPRLREKQLKNRETRRKRWLSRTWSVSRSGNDYLKTDNFHIVVFPKLNGTWGARVTDNWTGDSRSSKRIYHTEAEAKLSAFEAMLRMKERR